MSHVQTSQVSDTLMSEEDITQAVLGRASGYYRGLGPGPKPPPLKKRACSSSTDQTSAQELDGRLQVALGEIQIYKDMLQTTTAQLKETTERLGLLEKTLGQSRTSAQDHSGMIYSL
jgi:hypothetical protein